MSARLPPVPADPCPGSSAIHVLFCTDAGYFQHLAVAAVSLATQMPGRPLTLHVMTTAQDPVKTRMLRDSLQPFAHVTLILHSVGDRQISRLFTDRHVTPECYLRFLASEVLTPEILPGGRVLYLDCDLVVLRPIDALWRLDLQGKSTAAAPDFIWDRRGAGGAHLRSLGLAEDGLAEDSAYVNSGVLLMDLAAWRARDISRRLLDFAAARGSALRFHDQDALNVVLQDDIRRIDCRWNLQARMYRLGRRAFPEEYAQTIAARRDPAILHYTTARKPWAFRSRCPRKGLYHHYLARTEWRAATPTLTGPWTRAEYLLDRAVARMGGDYMVLADLAERLARLPARACRGMSLIFGLRRRMHPARQKDRP